MECGLLAKMAGVVPGFSREVLDSHDVFLFDCDGVLFRGTQVLEGVPATLAALQKQHGKVLIGPF